jgi:hypothetical protein
MIPVGFQGAATPLGPNDLAAVAGEMNVDLAAIEAVCDVESSGGGFLSGGRPKILFEAHVFGRLTDHRWDDEHPNVSAPAWDRSLYGAGGAHQYDRLAEAMTLDRRSALNSASWGMFQVLGLNDGQCGYSDVEAFVADMCESEAKQLEIFRRFCDNGGLTKYLRLHDWVRFAVRYNGAGQATNGYSSKLASAYLRHQGHDVSVIPSKVDAPHLIGSALLHRGSAGRDVVALQKALGVSPADGVFGPQTETAVKGFQIVHHLNPVDGIVGPATRAALAA